MQPTVFHNKSSFGGDIVGFVHRESQDHLDHVLRTTGVSVVHLRTMLGLNHTIKAFRGVATANLSSKGAIRTGSSIPVILLENVDNQGVAGEVVRVKRGFARNYLVPKKMAVYMSESNRLKHADLMATALNLEESSAQAKNAQKEAKSKLIEALKQIQGPITIAMKTVADTSALYGSVKSSSIAAALEERGVHVSASQIDADKIEEVGTHVISILGEKIEIEITSEV